MFTAEELASARQSQTDAMDKTCTVTVPGAEVDDNAGGTTPGVATVTAGIACRVGVPSAADQKVAERLGLVIDASVTLPYGTSVTGSATIAASNGKSYDVTHVNTEQTDQAAVRAMCRTARSEA